MWARRSLSHSHWDFGVFSRLFMISPFFVQSFSLYFSRSLVVAVQRHFMLFHTVVEISSGFSGAAGPRLFTIHQIDASTNNLPKAHTW